jgi:uncharacterized protein
VLPAIRPRPPPPPPTPAGDHGPTRYDGRSEPHYHLRCERTGEVMDLPLPYDPTQDDADATILTRILQAAVPVCAGISLEYYFSYVDNPGYGCGTKLPHNIAALLGVMDGAASDLRTGLPWQMVEIHEPVRILFVIETRPETMLRIMDCNPGIGKLCRNEWVRIAVLSPESAEIQVFRDGAFHAYQPQVTHLPRAASSTDWYRGWRDHLEFAEIEVAPAASGR